MPSLLLRTQLDGSPRSSLTLALVLLAASFVACLGTPAKHSLLTGAAAWWSIYIFCGLRTGLGALLSIRPATTVSWAAGALLALTQVCDRAVDGRGIWWAKSLVPVTIYGIAHSGLWVNDHDNGPSTPSSAEKERRSQAGGPTTILVILSLSALVAIYQSTGSNTVIALGLSYAFISAFALLLVERAYSEALHARQNGSVIYSANGLLSQPSSQVETPLDSATTTLRDVSVAAATACSVAAVALDSWHFGGLAYWGVLGQVMGDNWVLGQGILSFFYAVAIALDYVVLFVALILLTFKQKAFLTSLAPLSAVVFSELLLSFSLGRLWFAALFISSTFLFIDDGDSLGAISVPRARSLRVFTIVASVSLAVVLVQYWQKRSLVSRLSTAAPEADDPLRILPPPRSFAPLGYADNQVHPIDQLVRNAEMNWAKTLNSQSQTLEAAVSEYKRRYGFPPPPNFDKWFEFAKRKNVQLVDEYDSIYQSLLPFWAVSPATVRARAREAIGFGDNQLIGLLIREGRPVYVEGGADWQQQATVGMIEQFAQFLPDMDLAFNIHDEPRVVVPHDELSRLIHTALNVSMPAARNNPNPKNYFSPRPDDVNHGKRIDEAKITRFNTYAHQHVWIPSRLSCPPDSPARAFEETTAADNLTSYALSDLGFVYNHTAFSDVCNSPSFAFSHGFFDRPNAFSVVHDLFPIFSQSKMSCFQDILYPSPWYWFGKVSYNEAKDMSWDKKESKLWWRGSTTGGFSRDGGWRRQHRQQLVRKINAPDQARILGNARDINPDFPPDWLVKEVPREEYKELMDVAFSHVGQCDPGDCDAQKEFFKIVPAADQQDAWKYRFLLDMDGNAFSGRFYAFLKSHSLTFKMAVFREWHEEWIKPWVHYIPLSLRGEESLEAVRYFATEPEGKVEAVRVAEAGREWADKALRNADFEAWFFRLLLEYGRVVDDNRENIGYSGS